MIYFKELDMIFIEKVILKNYIYFCVSA